MGEPLVDVRCEEFENTGCEPMMLFWYVGVGDEVAAGQDLCEIETAKAAFVVPAPVAGVLVEVLVAETEAVASGQTLGRIRPA